MEKTTPLYVKFCSPSSVSLWFGRSFKMWQLHNNFWLPFSLIFCSVVMMIMVIPFVGPMLFLFLQPIYAFIFIVTYLGLWSIQSNPEKKALMSSADILSLFKHYFYPNKFIFIGIGLLHLMLSAAWGTLIFSVISHSFNVKGGFFFWRLVLILLEISLFFMISYLYQQVLIFLTALLSNLHFSAAHKNFFKSLFFTVYGIKKNFSPMFLQAFFSVCFVLFPLPFLILIGSLFKGSILILQILYFAYCGYFFFPIYYGSLYEAYIDIFYQKKDQS